MAERAAAGRLSAYHQKRDFARTPEPADVADAAGQAGARQPARRSLKQAAPQVAAGPRFVVQKHWASRLHYDFRLELDGVLLSWAVPKGPSYDPSQRQMAIHVEDHPLSYGSFEGTIPPGQYGAGRVIVWDHGTWEPATDPHQGLAAGKLLFKLHGQKLAGLWELVRISKPGEKKQDQWLLFKKRGDAWARPVTEYDVLRALPDSVVATPLGLIEQREPRSAAPAAASTKDGASGRKAGAAAHGSAAAVDLSAAVAAPLPAQLQPQLAVAVTTPPASGNWLVENKFDGYRLLARVDDVDGTVRLYTRAGHDWTDRLRSVADAVEEMGIASAWLDGEIVVMGDAGVPDFSRLQNAIDHRTRANDILYFVFDLPFVAGLDLRAVPLQTRRAVLQALLQERPSDRVLYSETFDASAADMLAAAQRLGLEGVMLKRADAPYASTRSETWLKLKCRLRQEFVVVGFADRAGATGEVGSLMLAVHEGTRGAAQQASARKRGELRAAGSVGTGWSSADARKLHQRLLPLLTDTPAVDPASFQPGRWSRRTAGQERWVLPTMVVEVEFTEWTPDGHVRHPIWRGVREDKPAEDVMQEVALTKRDAAAPAKPGARKVASTPASNEAAGVRITHPERVVDPSTGLTKADLVHYYDSVADWLLPHLRGRPVSLVRAPDGINGELFFQKHLDARLPGLTTLDASLWPGHAPLLTVDSRDALRAAAQMNVIEFHTWNSTVRSINQPDRIVFDLDPGDGVPWWQMQEAAVLVRAMLTELQLQSWLKTSGGKGLHVVVPIAPKLDFDAVKSFSQHVVQHIARTIPQRFVAKSGASNRVGKVFVDYLRNGFGQTTAAAFSARARPGMGVSMPVTWDALDSLKSGAQWTVATAREYLSFEAESPWAGYDKCRQTLTKAMKLLGRTA